jgi:hypothetical protein
VIPAIVTLRDQIVLRVYEGNDLVVEAPLSRRRALLITSDLINALLLPTNDDIQLEAATQQLIAQEPVHTPELMMTPLGATWGEEGTEMLQVLNAHRAVGVHTPNDPTKQTFQTLQAARRHFNRKCLRMPCRPAWSPSSAERMP